MKITNLFLFLTSIFFLTSCNDSDVWMSYNQTQCADKWQDRITDTTNDSQISEAVTGYLSDVLGIAVIEAVIIHDQDLLSACLACSCTAGKLIKVEVSESYIDELEELGFFQ